MLVGEYIAVVNCSGKFEHHFRLNQVTLTLTCDECGIQSFVEEKGGKKKGKEK
jgi:hypothetical protein